MIGIATKLIVLETKWIVDAMVVNEMTLIASLKLKTVIILRYWVSPVVLV